LQCERGRPTTRNSSLRGCRAAASGALNAPFELTNFGVNRTTLAPGRVSALLHAHTVQDEFIYVLAGNPTLVTDNGEQRLEPGM
jgi:uncharacterized cupin superfamily protein